MRDNVMAGSLEIEELIYQGSIHPWFRVERTYSCQCMLRTQVESSDGEDARRLT